MFKYFVKAISNALGFSKVESRGTLLLIFVMIVGIAFSRVYVNSLKNPTSSESVDVAELEKWVAEVESSYTVKSNDVGTDQKEFDKSVYYPSRKKYDDKKNQKLSSFLEANEIPKKLSSEKSIVIKDLNTATVEDFQKVKGIGPSFSDRIVKFRNSLGGFAANAQLEEVYGLPEETISEVLKYFEVQSGPTQININSDSAKVLARHPYISYDLAWIIINYRKQNGEIQSPDELKKIQAIDEETFARLKPYLD